MTNGGCLNGRRALQRDKGLWNQIFFIKIEILKQNGVSIHKRGKYPYTAIWKRGRKIVAKQKPYVMHINSTGDDVSFFIKRTKYKIRSGELNKTVRAKNRTEAVLKAVKRHRKSLSQIIMVTEKGKKEFDESYFFATEDILKKLNFEIVKE